MRYSFSQFTGRLSSPNAMELPGKYGKGVESPTIQYMEGTKLSVTDPPRGKGRYAAVPPKLQAKMRLFQFPNGLPVHIKGGPIDKILFALTGAVCFVGLVDCFKVYYDLSYPRMKNE